MDVSRYPDSVYIIDIQGYNRVTSIGSIIEKFRSIDFIREVKLYKKNSIMLIVEPGEVDTSRVKEVMRDAGVEKYWIVH